mmetsp:Transcript_11569/g.25720  ORF Transcript_11569/g.25720 Transcript_11569/m.25720 type:complete len:342 (+) Transcript_11569:1832-2857(+)
MEGQSVALNIRRGHHAIVPLPVRLRLQFGEEGPLRRLHLYALEAQHAPLELEEATGFVQHLLCVGVVRRAAAVALLVHLGQAGAQACSVLRAHIAADGFGAGQGGLQVYAHFVPVVVAREGVRICHVERLSQHADGAAHADVLQQQRLAVVLDQSGLLEEGAAGQACVHHLGLEHLHLVVAQIHLYRHQPADPALHRGVAQGAVLLPVAVLKEVSVEAADLSVQLDVQGDLPCGGPAVRALVDGSLWVEVRSREQRRGAPVRGVHRVHAEGASSTGSRICTQRAPLLCLPVILYFWEVRRPATRASCARSGEVGFVIAGGDRSTLKLRRCSGPQLRRCPGP